MISIPDGDVLDGAISSGKLKLVEAWVDIHKDDLMADWDQASSGHTVSRSIH